MKSLRAPVAAMLLFALSIHASASLLDSGRSQISPITRTVELLKSMSTRLEQDHQTEENLYEKFVCWATSIIRQKKQSNTDASSRIDYLQTYIDDLSSGRIELTTERVDLEKDIESLTGDIEVANQMREKEASDYEMAKEELDQAIAALTKAIEVLRTATEGHEDGVLLGLRGSVSQGSAARAREAASLNKAVELGNRVLTKGDSLFLRRLLTGEVPQRESWKKLNRKATFKMDYKARSFKIQSVLARLLETFSSELSEATAKEQEATGLYNRLMTSKSSEKGTAQEALTKMDMESGARGLSLTEARQEKDALTTQVSNDNGYISDVQLALSNKKSQWKDRQELRAGEQAAISKAIAILHNADARDLFTKSYASQGTVFLQEGSSQSARAWHQSVKSAQEVIRAAAYASHDSRLLKMTTLTGRFDEVITAINNTVEQLNNEEASDLQQKEGCEADRAADTREAITTARDMDDLTDKVTALRAKIAEITTEIEQKESRVAEIKVELGEILAMRTKEHSEHLLAEKDDQDAAALVSQAKTTIGNFYVENGMAFVQGKHREQQPAASVAGEAPPPPPPTWDGAYGGRTEEASGIVSILGMIHDDIMKDIAKADADEAASLGLYQKTKSDLDGESINLNTAIGLLESDRSGKEQDVQTNIGDRTNKKGLLATVTKKISDAAPGCDFVTINFSLRSKNRQIEIDGLEKARAILSGARFDGLPDPSRELKPGDALLMQANSRSSRKFLRRAF